MVGVLFPPALLGAAAVGGVTGGLIGHFHGGMSRKDVRELGEMLDASERLPHRHRQGQARGDSAEGRPEGQKTVERQLDVDGKDLEKELADAQTAAG